MKWGCIWERMGSIAVKRESSLDLCSPGSMKGWSGSRRGWLESSWGLLVNTWDWLGCTEESWENMKGWSGSRRDWLENMKGLWESRMDSWGRS